MYKNVQKFGIYIGWYNHIAQDFIGKSPVCAGFTESSAGGLFYVYLYIYVLKIQTALKLKNCAENEQSYKSWM